MDRIIFRKDIRELSEAEIVLSDYPLTAEEEEMLVPVVERLLADGKEIPESSEELLELCAETKDVTLHKDGTVTYWSVHKQNWQHGSRVPDKDFAALTTEEQEAIDKHITTNKKTVFIDW